MPLFQHPAIGIDLGTTYSVVSKLDEFGSPRTLPNAEGERTTPSAVLFDDGEIIVGSEALKAVAVDATKVALCAKRELGNSEYSKKFDGRSYPPEVIEAMVLNKLREDTKSQIGDFHQAVITVPAYFDERRRKATQDAGYMAGFEVLDIINEPTAAALAYGASQSYLDAQGAMKKPMNLLVYDLGGGTFDVTVMRLEGTDFTALVTDGDVHLGGQEWDDRLVDYCASEFLQQHMLDPRGDEATHGRLWRECEAAKRSLSIRNKTSFTINFQGKSLNHIITRNQFEQLTRDLLDRTRFTTEQAVANSGLKWEDIDELLLVGGSTRMPAVQAMLKLISGKDPKSVVSADEAVAHGAALRAGILLAQKEKRPRFKITNVNSHSLGVVGTEPATRLPRTGVLIPRNRPLPALAKRMFQTQKEGQKTLLVEIVEGESQTPAECSPLGRCIARNLPANLPAGTPIEVIFRYAENGRLEVRVSLGDGKKLLAHEITRENSLTQDQLDAWREYITGVQITPSVKKPNENNPSDPAPTTWRWA